jgi:SAM-dependent methyltransferase
MESHKPEPVASDVQQLARPGYGHGSGELRVAASALEGFRPCRFSPDTRTARRLAAFYADMMPSGARLLDVGFGQGHLLQEAQDRGLEAVGLDRDPALVAAARSNGHTVHEGDLLDLCELGEPPFDVIVANHVIEHLDPESLTRFFDHCHRLLVDDGRLLLSTPDFRDQRVATHLFWVDPTHVRPYPQEAVRSLLDDRRWGWISSGQEPAPIRRDYPKVLLGRLRFGRSYGRSSWWCLIGRRSDG